MLLDHVQALVVIVIVQHDEQLTELAPVALPNSLVDQDEAFVAENRW